MGTRPIITTYHGPTGVEVWKNRSGTARAAVRNAVDHMQMNDYGASVATVHDDETAELHAVITYNFVGELKIQFKRDPVNPVCLMLDH